MSGRPAGDDRAIQAAARLFECKADLLQAIWNVESADRPFDGKGRLTMLPEKHVFFRELPEALRQTALRAKLASRKWSRKNYDGLGSPGDDRRWNRLEAMCRIDETAGLRSASYGGPQIMGFNHAHCGFPTVSEFVIALAESEDNQVAAMVSFLVAMGLKDELQDGDVRALTRRYNGNGQVDRYSALILAEYKRLTGSDLEVAETRASMLRLGSKGHKVRALQERLVALGYHVVVDGDFGPATRRQVVAFQADHGLTPDGLVGPLTDRTLGRAVPIADQPGNSRSDLTVKDLRERGSETVKNADWLTRGGAILMGTGAVVEGSDLAEGAEGPIGWLRGLAEFIRWARSPLETVLGFVRDHPFVTVLVIGGVVIFIAHRIKSRRLEDARTWRHVG